jgi:hypothetical protein
MPRFDDYLHTVPLLAPVDNTTADYESPFLDLQEYHWITFYHFVGELTDGDQLITLEVSSVATSAIVSATDFVYRKALVGVDTWGDNTAGTSDGIYITSADIGYLFAIDVDPGNVISKLSGGRYVRLQCVASSSPSAQLISSWAVLEPRYPRHTQKSTSA